MSFAEVVNRASVGRDVVARLKAAFPALASRVYTARRWPTMAGTYPALLVYFLAERMTNRAEAGGAPSFRVDASLAVHWREEAATEEAVETALNAAVDVLKGVLLQDAEWVAQFEAINSVDVLLALKEDGETIVGDAVLTFALQWNEDEFPPIPSHFATASMTAEMPDGDAPTVNLSISLPTS